jgi:hypothetical protein
MEYERRELQRECLRQMTVSMLLELYKNHDELYYLPYCDKVLREVEYELRQDILIVLEEKLDEEMQKGE